MIYLLFDVYLKDISDLSSVERVLKIGYSSDSFIAKRKPAYDTHNFGYAFVTEIEGTEDDEKQMHFDFKDLCIGGEWFKYDSRILQRFGVEEDNLQSISTQMRGGRIANGKCRVDAVIGKYKHIIKRFINRWLCIDSSADRDSFSDKYKSAIKLLETLMPDTQETLISGLLEHFKIQDDKIITGIRDFLDGKLLNSEHISKLLSDFEQLNGFTEKMRFVCTERMSEEEERCVFLDQIPLVFKNYYLTLGPDRCKALAYNKTWIEQKYQDSQIDLSGLDDIIYSAFEVGKRYLRSDIKETLGKIYTDYGLVKKSPKASDLSEWFNMKTCKMTNSSTGVVDNGFKIISKKK